MKKYIPLEIEVLNVAKDIITSSGYGTSDNWNDFINNDSDMPL